MEIYFVLTSSPSICMIRVVDIEDSRSILRMPSWHLAKLRLGFRVMALLVVVSGSTLVQLVLMYCSVLVFRICDFGWHFLPPLTSDNRSVTV